MLIFCPYYPVGHHIESHRRVQPFTFKLSPEELFEVVHTSSNLHHTICSKAITLYSQFLRCTPSSYFNNHYHFPCKLWHCKRQAHDHRGRSCDSFISEAPSQRKLEHSSCTSFHVLMKAVQSDLKDKTGAPTMFDQLTATTTISSSGKVKINLRKRLYMTTTLNLMSKATKMTISSMLLSIMRIALLHRLHLLNL